MGGRTRLVILVLTLTTACESGATTVCPAIEGVNGVYLDWRPAALPGNVAGELCIDELCRTIAQLRGNRQGGLGRELLPTAALKQSARVRVALRSDQSPIQVTDDEVIPLLLTRPGDPCHGKDRTRVVFVTRQGLVLGSAGPP